MSKINAINNQSAELTIDPGASGDSFVQFDINTTGEFIIGVDDSDGDAFVISQGSALGTTNTFRMSAAGERTMPLQSSFLAYNSAIDSGVTGDGTVYTVDFDTEVFDQNADFAADTFTAPVTGRYHLTACAQTRSTLAAAHTGSIYRIVTSNRTYYSGILNPGALRNNLNRLVLIIETVADMDASDTATMQISISGGGAGTVGVGGGSTLLTYFCGHLVC